MCDRLELQAKIKKLEESLQRVVKEFTNVVKANTFIIKQLTAENKRLKETLKWIEHHGYTDGLGLTCAEMAEQALKD